MKLPAIKALLLIFATSILAGTPAPVAKPDTTKITHPTGDTARCSAINNERGSEFLPSILCHHIKIADAAVIFLTACLVLLNWLLWSTQRKSAESQVRAYVAVDSVDMLLSTGNITVGIKNGGQTPAYDVRAWLDYNLDEPFSIDDIEKMKYDTGDTKTVVGPLWNVGGRSLVFNIKDFDSVKPAVYYIAGVILYTDVFKKERSTTFQSKADFDGYGWVVSDHFEGGSAT